MTAKPSPAEILAEPAGPRLDGWVAEHVLRWRRPVGPADVLLPDAWQGQDEKGNWAWAGWWAAEAPQVAGDYYEGDVVAPEWALAGACRFAPSTNVATLWQVVGILHSRRWVLTLSPAGASIGPFGYDATETVKCKGPDEALAAACKAALLAAVGGYLA